MPQENERYEVNVPVVKLLDRPFLDASIETELLFGETVRIHDNFGEFSEVSTGLYSSNGFVLRKHLRKVELHRRSVSATHRVVVPQANLYSQANFKFPDPDDRFLTMNALVHGVEFASTPQGNMVHVEGLGWLFSNQLLLMAESLPNYVDAALLYVGRAYTWGSRVNPDCSGLVQQVLLACGISCCRNVGEQSITIGLPVDFAPDFSNLQKGDFVFWTDPSTKGRHVVIMTDSKNCVHATIAQSGLRSTVVQLLSEVIFDQERDGNGRPTAVRRFPGYWKK